MEPGESTPQQELTIPLVEDYLEQIDTWEERIIPQINSREGGLPADWPLQHRNRLVAQANRENSRLVPLIQAEFVVDPSIVEQDTDTSPIGQPMVGEGLEVRGHMSDSSLWLIDGKQNTIQTMVRLAVRGQGGTQLIDVYSRPVHPGFTRVKDVGLHANVAATRASRALNLLNHVESNKLKVLGWVPIPEIEEHKIPTYTSKSL